jgi:hypothetical protein
MVYGHFEELGKAQNGTQKIASKVVESPTAFWAITSVAIGGFS